MLKYLMLLFIVSSAMASDVNFKTDEERTLKVIKESQEVRAEIKKEENNKRAVASINSNVIDETGELDAFLANAESELEEN